MSDPLSSTEWTQELRKRKREVSLVLVLSLMFIGLTWFEIRLFSTSQQLPFVHSVFFFGLVNFNIIILLLLLFLIFRNVVKTFVEKRGKIYGSSLKAKLIAAFAAFSFIPTLLMFIISVFYINSSFDKWFNVKMVSVLKSSLDVTNAYYFSAKKKNYHYAHQVAQNIKDISNEKELKRKMVLMREIFSLDAVELYPSLFESRIVVQDPNQFLAEIPAVSLELLQKGIKSKNEASTIHQYGEGNLVRAIVPFQGEGRKGAIVVSSYVPLSLTSKMNDVASAYEEFKESNPLESPLKSIYLIILFLITLVILLAATWFGFYLAKQLSVPLVHLGRATRRVSGGDYTLLNIKSGSDEINTLVESFNQMTLTLESSLKNLDQHSRYIEVILKNINAGVISVDQKGIVTTINRRAAHLLKIEPSRFIGRSVRDLLTLEYFRTFYELFQTLKNHGLESIEKEFVVQIEEEEKPLHINISLLKNEKEESLGVVVVFDDMSPIMNAQRAAAWADVARRIAHEIKNPLTPIRLSAERLERKFGDQVQDAAFKECTGMIIKQTEDLKNLVNEFSQFARLPKAHPVKSSLNQVISAAARLYQQSHEQIRFELILDERLPEFKFDPEQLHRVMVNLIDNAIAAVQGKLNPKIMIESVFNLEIRLVQVIVSDNGVGIPHKDRSKVFEPYMSTKESGTGLGLAIVKRIVEDHNGFIRAFPNENQGTKMIIELPVALDAQWKPGQQYKEDV
ncbi:MAG TPA: ATP-binding protein [Pseudobdellovibrionaceae bacterium]|nr:ATP-binding protein [Pseudobdellovibrionaceae bacterium]